VHQANTERGTGALLQTDKEEGAGKAGGESSQSTEMMERGRPGEEYGTVGRGEFSVVGISLLKPEKLIYWQGFTWFGLLASPVTRSLKLLFYLLMI